MRLPMGYVRRPSGEVAKDPDEQAQAVIQTVFDQFERLGTLNGVLQLWMVSISCVYMVKFVMRGEFKRQRDSSLDWTWTVKWIDVDCGRGTRCAR
jgi:hypothetical protein